MSTIQLKNIKIYAFHGCLPEEEKIGSDYIVNLSVKANLDKASKSDELTDTVDYVLLQKIVAEQMAIKSKLLEHVGKRIVDKILLEISQVNYIKIMVRIERSVGTILHLYANHIRVTMSSQTLI
jgi:dihydroneopterin aldolase